MEMWSWSDFLSSLMAAIFLPAGVLFFWTKEARAEREYRRTHPPISDEEYLKLCDPTLPPHVCLTVREILADCLGVDRDEIYPDSRLMKDFGPL